MAADASEVPEREAIQRLRARLGPVLGDDAAVLQGGLVACADVVVEGVHFTASTPLADVGWKAVVVNVSDVAAMGARPESCLVTVSGCSDVDALYDGITEACERYGCAVVGGDLSAGEQLVVSLTMLGRLDGSPVMRSGARPGDAVYVTGPLGHAAASGYTTRPVARLEEGLAAARAGATAMIDLSDGLSTDLHHLCEESGVGARVEHVPVADGATEEQAMNGGEDFELLYAGPEGMAGIRIGTIVDDVTQRPEPRGWEHR
jgi:thiamine-monophosphate kinase